MISSVSKASVVQHNFLTTNKTEAQALSECNQPEQLRKWQQKIILYSELTSGPWHQSSECSHTIIKLYSHLGSFSRLHYEMTARDISNKFNDQNVGKCAASMDMKYCTRTFTYNTVKTKLCTPPQYVCIYMHKYLSTKGRSAVPGLTVACPQQSNEI